MEKQILDFSNPVGDPMVEIGRLGLIEFCGKDKFDGVKELKPYVEKLFNNYIFNTAKTLNQVFSDNSKFTHNSSTNDLKKRYKNTIEYFDNFIEQKYSGYCMSCGDKDNLSNVEKMIFPLTTGDKNVNFTSNFSSNILMCKACMSSLFFSPINMKKVDWGKAFPISNNHEINTFWTEENIEIFKSNIVKNVDILPDSRINIFENFIYSTIEELQEEELFGDITFYLISNVDRNTKIELVHVYEKQIRFIHQVAPKFLKNELPTKQKDEWNYLIFKYAYKERKENSKKVKFQEEVIDNKNYKSTMKYFNPLISNFIQGKSILYYFKKNLCSWNLTTIYLKEIKGMREERLNIIKKVADNLQLFNEDDKTFYTKFVRPIEMTKSQTEFRENLRILMRKFLSKSDEPLFTADEMVLYILPSGESWYETKDILLIALYEKMNLKAETIENLNEGDNDE